MKGIVATALGSFESILACRTDLPTPKIATPTQVLIQVEACSISPGDFRRIRGDVDGIFHPKVPFVVGMDICGKVIQVGEQATFQVGDVVVGSDDSFIGGMAEYKVMESQWLQKKPSTCSSVEAATLPTSARRAMIAIEQAGIQGKERVLVIGGSGGFGCFLIQLLKVKQVPYLAVVSTQETLMKSLGADEVIDYTTEEFWKRAEYQQTPFDVIFDCVGGPDIWPRITSSRILKSQREGGFFFGIAMYDPVMQVHSWFGIVTLMAPYLGRLIYNWFARWDPKYRLLLVEGKSSSEELKQLFQMVESENVKVILDPASPYPFTVEGAIAAFNLQASRHAHGKIVMKMEA